MCDAPNFWLFQLFLEEAESCLENADSSSESSLLLKQTCAVLRSQLCCMEHKVTLQSEGPARG